MKTKISRLLIIAIIPLFLEASTVDLQIERNYLSNKYKLKMNEKKLANEVLYEKGIEKLNQKLKNKTIVINGKNKTIKDISPRREGAAYLLTAANRGHEPAAVEVLFYLKHDSGFVSNKRKVRTALAKYLDRIGNIYGTSVLTQNYAYGLDGYKKDKKKAREMAKKVNEVCKKNPQKALKDTDFNEHEKRKMCKLAEYQSTKLRNRPTIIKKARLRQLEKIKKIKSTVPIEVQQNFSGNTFETILEKKLMDYFKTHPEELKKLKEGRD